MGIPDWTIFLDSGIFLGRKIGQVFFGGGLIKVGILLVIYNNLKIHGSASISWLHSSEGQLQPNKVNMLYRLTLSGNF